MADFQPTAQLEVAEYRVEKFGTILRLSPLRVAARGRYDYAAPMLRWLQRALTRRYPGAVMEQRAYIQDQRGLHPGEWTLVAYGRAVCDVDAQDRATVEKMLNRADGYFRNVFKVPRIRPNSTD